MSQQKKLLVVSFIPTHPPYTGGSRRLLNLLRLIQSWGWEIHFFYYRSPITHTGANIKAMKHAWSGFYELRFSRKIFSTYLDKFLSRTSLAAKKILPPFYHQLVTGIKKTFNIETSDKIDYYYDPAITKKLKKISSKQGFDAVMVEMTFLSKVLESLDDSMIKIIDTVDSLTFYETDHKERLTPADEAECLNRADIIIATQDEEAVFFRSLVDINKTIVTVGHLDSFYEPVRNIPDKKILFVGSDSWHNVSSLDFLIREIWPRLKKLEPRVELLVAGLAAPRPMADGNITFLGLVKDLRSVYDKVSVVISPVWAGAGLNIKNVEALYLGKPLVATNHSSRGLLAGAGRAFWVADSPHEFAFKINELLRDGNKRHELSEAALFFIKNYHAENLTNLKSIFNAGEE